MTTTIMFMKKMHDMKIYFQKIKMEGKENDIY